MIAISPDTVEQAQTIVQELDLDFEVLSDPDAEFASALGIAHDYPIVQSIVPYPTTFVVDTQGAIAFAHVGESVSDRADCDDVVEALEALRP